MKATKNWLRKYIDRTFTTEEIDVGLTQAGIEVEGVDDLSASFAGVVVGQVVEREKHPDADRLSLCKVDVGDKELVQIICGAPNCVAGMKTPVAKVGAVLPGGFKIKKAKLKGIESFGMLCSAQELEIDSALLSEAEREGIWTLPEDWEIGVDLKKAIGFDDVTFELGITPNRSDCLGMLNVARELGMMYEEKVTIPEVNDNSEDPAAATYVSVEIEDPELSNRYIARIVKDIKISPSPLWMQKVLRASGMRPINNIVDITNYVMLETGQPLHAFDYDKLEDKKIVVRAAKEGEKIETLDGIERTLDSEMILIVDGKKPVAVAGVMGGANSEVDDSTVNILFESAHFAYASVRNTSRKLGLRSEASSRFERGIAPEVSMYAVNRAVDLVEQMQAGSAVPGAVDAYPIKQEKHIVELDPARVNATLGTDINAEDMQSYFVRLGFDVIKEAGSDKAKIDIPYYRTDITRHVDLIEEVARIYGYDKIPTTLPVSATNTKRQKKEITLSERVKENLYGLGLSEIITYAFIHPEEYKKLQREEWLEKSVRILNPLSEAQSVMRASLLPGILNIAKNNIRKNQKNLQIFEVGKVFEQIKANELPKEERRVACLVTGDKIKNWYGYSNEIDFFYMKGIAETLLENLGIEGVSFVQNKEDSTCHPGRCASIMVDGKTAGSIGEVHPQVLENYGIDQRIYVMELTLDGFEEVLTNVKSYSELPKYPSSNRDIAFTIKEDVLDSDIMQVIAGASSDKLVDYRLFDVYNGEQIEDGYKSLAYNLTYQDSEKTLTDEEVAEIHQSIQNSLEEKLGAKLR